jgi:hypothetical protein
VGFKDRRNIFQCPVERVAEVPKVGAGASSWELSGWEIRSRFMTIAPTPENQHLLANKLIFFSL